MSFQLSKKELFYHRKNFFENMKNHGAPCRIYGIDPIESEAYDFYHDLKDEDTSHVDYIDTCITYEEVPKIKTLKSLGWYVDDEELPAIAYIPVLYQSKYGKYADFKPNIDDRIQITVNPHDTNVSTRDFLLKDFKGNGFPSVIYYTVKLVPMRVGVSS